MTSGHFATAAGPSERDQSRRDFATSGKLQRRLEIPRDQRIRRSVAAFGVAPGEIHAAHGSEARMPAESRTGEIETRVENIFVMLPRRQPVIDDECEHDVARGGFAI